VDKKTAVHSVVLQILQWEMQLLKAVSFAKGHLLAERSMRQNYCLSSTLQSQLNSAAQ